MSLTTMDKIFNIKAEDYLLGLPSEHIDLTVTSPPYDTLRKYNNVFDLELIVKELYRATKQGGVVFGLLLIKHRMEVKLEQVLDKR